MKTTKLLFILCFFLTSLLAEENPELYGENELRPMNIETPAGFDIADIHGAPETIVEGVNIITGSFNDNDIDMVVFAPEPLVVQRSFSGDCKEFLSKWQFEYDNGVCPDHKDYNDVNLHDYKRHLFRLGSLKIPINGAPCSPFYEKGWTNCSSTISGKTNIRNFRQYIVNTNPGSPQLYVDGSGTKYKVCHRHIHEIERPSKNSIYFFAEVDEKDLNQVDYLPCQTVAELGSYKLRRLTSNNFLGQTRATLFFHGEINDPNSTYCAEGTNGLKTFYTFEKVGKKILLKEVYRSEFPNVAFISLENGFRKHLPEGRYVQVEGSKGKVQVIKAPLGTDNNPINKYTFEYGQNATVVYDAKAYPTQYHYNGDNRITAIFRALPGNQNYPIKKFYWSSDPTEKGFLRGMSVSDACNNFYAHRVYTYDSRGNIVAEQLYGNLTGNNRSPIILNPDGTAQNNGCECFGKEYAYSQDGYNNLLLENNGRKITRYQYAPNSDLMTAQFIHSFRGIEQRHFYNYDADGVLISELIDDGKNDTPFDYTGATQCIIKRIVPRQCEPFGLPEIVAESYLDFSTGQEVLLKKTIHAYSIEGRLLRSNIYDADGQFVYCLNYVYDQKGNLVEETNAVGRTTYRRYDGNKNVVFEQGPSPEFHKEFVYDFCNRLVREDVIKSDGSVYSVSYKYDVLGQKSSTIDIYGNETHFTYDVLGRLTHVRYPLVKNEEGSPFNPYDEFTYDTLGNPIIRKNSHGLTTITEYNIRGKPTKITYPDCSQESFEYSLDGLLVKTVAKNGAYTLLEYDYQGRPLSKKFYDANHVLLSQTSAVYNAFHLLKEIDAAGMETLYSYDFAGRPKSIQKGELKTEFEYDSLGRVCTLVEWINATEKKISRKSYDLLNRVIEELVEDQNGKILTQVRYGYDERGNRSHTWQFLGDKFVSMEVVYDCFGNPCKTINPEGYETHIIENYGYYNDLQQRVPCQITIDALGQQTLIVKDALGKVVSTKKFDVLGQEIQQTQLNYDLLGQMRSTVYTVYEGHTPGKKIINSFNYDLLGRINEMYEAWGEPEQKRTETCYNQYGFKEVVIKPDGTQLRHHYDAFGQLVDFWSSDDTFSYHFEYDVSQNLVKVEDRKNGRQTQKIYDRYNRLVKEILANGLTMEYGYDQLARPIKAILANGKEVSYCYDAAFLREVSCEAFHHAYVDYDLCGYLRKTKTLNKFETQYDYTDCGKTKWISTPQWKEEIPAYSPVGQILKINKTVNSQEKSMEYGYDALYQLAFEKGDVSHNYQYDSLHNRTKKDDKSYLLNALNQLLDDSDNKYTYDRNGNLIADGKATYEYDGLDRLVAVVKADERVEYSYDELNRRLLRTVFEPSREGWKKTSQTKFMYQGQNEVGSFDGTKWEWRILGKGKGAEIGASIYMEVDNKAYLPVSDHIGNIACLLDLEGNLVEHYEYSAFGEEQLFTKPISPWRFAAKRVDEETGFVFFGFRYYNPVIGRWVTADPAGFGDGPNLYAYVINNPLSHFDLYGYERCDSPSLYDCNEERNRSEARSEGRSTSGDSGWSSPPRDRETNPSRDNDNASHEGRSFNPITAIGNAIYEVATHLLPCGPWRTIARKFAKLICGEREANITEDTSCFGRIGGNAVYESLALIGVNGVLNDRDGGIYNALTLQKAFNGEQVTMVHNSTKGLLSDLFDVIAEKLGFMTDSVHQFVKAVEQAYRANPNATILVAAHSEGGQIVYTASRYLPEHIRAQMHVMTFGSAKLIPQNVFGRCVNYVSKSDPIPMIADPINYAKAALGISNNTDVRFLDSKVTFGFDHPFNGEVYQRALRSVALNYTKSEGK